MFHFWSIPLACSVWWIVMSNPPHPRIGVTPITGGPLLKFIFAWHVFCSPGNSLLISAMTCWHISCTSFTKESLLNLFRGGMFLFLGLLSFAFCYDLDLWAEGQALGPFFIGTSFAIILSRVWEGVWSNIKKLHRPMTLLLTYFCTCCVGLDFPIQWPRSLVLKN